MKIMAVNAGSSSLKFQLLEMPSETLILTGIIEKIGFTDSIFTVKYDGKKEKEVLSIPNHSIAVELLLKKIIETKVVKSLEEIIGVGHRVVHGAELFKDSVLIDDEVIKNIESVSDLAPLHNPANLTGIFAFSKALPNTKSVAVFDTAFHQTMEETEYIYSVPYEWYTEYGVRKYGFHGTSHKYVAEQARIHLGEENSKKMVTIHLGGGCSMTAIKNGESVDTSLGFGPNEGLIMGSRSGAVDNSIIFYLVNNLGYDLNDVNNMLQKESGMIGLTGCLSDYRDIEAEAEKGDEKCQLALNMSAYRIKHYLGGYIANLNGVDAIIFTAGVGENSIVLRKMVCESMEFFGIEIDEEKNDIKARKLTEIHSKNSKVKVLIIPTNEELEIAIQSFHLLN